MKTVEQALAQAVRGRILQLMDDVIAAGGRPEQVANVAVVGAINLREALPAMATMMEQALSVARAGLN